MHDFADKGWITDRQQARSSDATARRRERTFRFVAHGTAWVLMAMIGALAGYNVALSRAEPVPRSSLRNPAGPGYCVTYYDCKVCEQHSVDNRIIYSTMAC